MNDKRSTSSTRVSKICAESIFGKEILLRPWIERRTYLGYKDPPEGEEVGEWEPMDARILHGGTDDAWEEGGSEFLPSLFLQSDEVKLVSAPAPCFVSTSKTYTF
jgi:hypothetical protein